MSDLSPQLREAERVRIRLWARLRSALSLARLLQDANFRSLTKLTVNEFVLFDCFNLAIRKANSHRVTN